MKRLFLFEWKRAVRTPGFVLSLCIGNIITVLHWIMKVLPLAEKLDSIMSEDIPMEYPAGVFTEWIGEGSTQFSYLYFLILPLLVALPYASSFFGDIKNNFINMICTKTDRKSFFICRYAAVFLSGGIVGIIPLITNLLLTMMVLPCVKPEISAYFSLVIPKSSFVELYLYAIWLYIFVSLFIIFMYSGIIAGFALVAAFYCNHLLTVLFSPLILQVFLSSLFELSGRLEWQSTNFLHPGYFEPRVVPMISLSILILIITIVEYFIKGSKGDIC